MILEKFLRNSNDNFLDYAEIYLGGNTKTYSPQAAVCEIPYEYKANSIKRRVPIYGLDGIPWVLLKIEKGGIQKSYCYDKFPIHPLEKQHIVGHFSYNIIGDGTPLSNVRTLHIKKKLDDFPDAGFIKMSIPRRISRFQRTVHSFDVIHEIACSAQLMKLKRPYLPSCCGGFLTSEDGISTGFVLRPNRLVNCNENYRFMPLFALYGEDISRKKDTPLLTQMIHSQKVYPLEFVLQNIVYPLVRLWIDSIMECGLLLSLHGQNSLVCFDDKGKICDIGFRGTHSFVIPKEKQIPELYLYKRCVIGEDLCRPFNEVASLLYDSFLGDHVFRYIQELLYRDFDVKPCVFAENVKEIFKKCGGLELPMSKGVFYYPKDYYGDSSSKLRLGKITETNVWR